MAISSLIALGRHTVTGMIATSGNQFCDWSSAYRLFENERIDKTALFEPVLAEVCARQSGEEPLFCMMDDTLIKKRGQKISGTSWRRDPLGPAFHTNFVWGQRFLQLCAALPDTDKSGRARAIPIDFIHAPGAKRPKRTATDECWDAYRKEQSMRKVSVVGRCRLENLQKQLPDKKIVMAVDGGFTNKTVFRDTPDNTVLIGRIRKDAKLFEVPPKEDIRRGRKKFYGNRLPTPEQVRQNEQIPWQEIRAFASGRIHTFNVKTLPCVRWMGTGDKDVLVVIIRPLSYRKSAKSRLLYRQPAYLICTDPSMALDQLLQAYLWRWEIECSFRDEKTVLGVGEAQVRNFKAVESVPALIVAAYAYLLLAQTSPTTSNARVVQPKWRHYNPQDRPSTQQMIALLRSDLWRLGMDTIKTHFVSTPSQKRSTFYSTDTYNPAPQSMKSAIFYARK